MAISLDEIKAEAERRHRYVCDRPLLVLKPGVRASHDYRCSTCDGLVSISDLEVSLKDTVTRKTVDAVGLEEWLENGGGVEAGAVVDHIDHPRHIHISCIEVAAKDPDRWIANLQSAWLKKQRGTR